MHSFLLKTINKPLQLDLSGSSGGLLFFTKSHLLTRPLTKVKIPRDIQIIIFELKLQKEKWLLLPVYKHSAQNAIYFLN